MIADVNGEAFGHKCFGCGREIQPFEEHIHVGLDEWLLEQGLETFGLDALLIFPFCSKCTKKSDRGWIAEAHDLPATTSAESSE